MHEKPLARSALAQGYRQSGITRLCSVLPEAGLLFRLAARSRAPLTAGFFYVRKRVAEISVGQGFNARSRVSFSNKINKTQKTK